MTENALVPLDTANPIEVFTEDGMNNLLNKVESIVDSIVVDVSTDDGKANVRSFARKIKTTKSQVETMRKDLVLDKKRELAKIDEQGRMARDTLDRIHDRFRRPLTDLEEKEKDRVAALKEARRQIEDAPYFEEHLTADEIHNRIVKVNHIYDTTEWQELSVKIIGVKDDALSKLKEKLEAREALDRETAELERKQKEEAERRQREREDQIRKEEAERVRKEEEERYKKLEAEKEAAEKRAEAERQARIEREKREAYEAEQREKEDAARKKQEAEAAKQAAKEAHRRKEQAEERRAKVRNEIIDTLTDITESDDLAVDIYDALADGRIPHTTINF